MDNFIKILKDYDYDNDDIIKDFLLDKELEFYNNDMKDIIISLGFSVPNYNILTSLLEVYDNVDPIETEMFARRTFQFLLFISARHALTYSSFTFRNLD